MNCEGSRYVGVFSMLINNRTLNTFKNISCKFDNVVSDTAYIMDIIYTFEIVNKPTMCGTSVMVANCTCDCDQTQILLKDGVIHTILNLSFTLCILLVSITWLI